MYSCPRTRGPHPSAKKCPRRRGPTTLYTVGSADLLIVASAPVMPEAESEAATQAQVAALQQQVSELSQPIDRLLEERGSGS